MRLGGFSLPLERLSATSLSSFLSCPRAFQERYLLDKKERLGGARFVGSVTHSAIQSLFTPSFFENTDGSAEAAVSIAWEEMITKEGDPDWREDEDAVEMYRRTKQMIKEYLPFALANKPIAVEQRFEEQIAGVTIVGYIDRELNDRILEVKTAGQKVSKPKPRWNLQARLYALASNKPIEFHVLTRQVQTKIYTAQECPELYIEGFNADVTVRIVKQAVERMNDCYARFGKDQPWPMDGILGDWACSRCSFRKSCPAWAT